MSTSSRSPYVHSLDWVRALTIVAVVIVHAIRFGLVPRHRIFGSLLQLAFQFGRVAFMVVIGGWILRHFFGHRHSSETV